LNFILSNVNAKTIGKNVIPNYNSFLCNSFVRDSLRLDLGSGSGDFLDENGSDVRSAFQNRSSLHLDISPKVGGSRDLKPIQQTNLFYNGEVIEFGC
jgi:hypothetical protein